MDNVYLNWTFKVLEDGSLEFGDESKPDRFFMKEGDEFRCEYKNGRTTLVKIQSSK